MADGPSCPDHGPEFQTFNDKWGYGCRKKVGEGHPLANERGYCKWKAKAGNGATARPAGSSAAPAKPAWGGKTPDERRSIEAQCSMKCATELYGPLLAGLDINTRATLISEMVATAYKINDGIRWMAGAKREEIRDAVQGPPPREPGEDDWTYDQDAERFGQ